MSRREAADRDRRLMAGTTSSLPTPTAATGSAEG
jgi:hypothetical protein